MLAPRRGPGPPAASEFVPDDSRSLLPPDVTSNRACRFPIPWLVALTSIATRSANSGCPHPLDKRIQDMPSAHATRNIAVCLWFDGQRSEEHTSELQSPVHLVCRLLLEKKNKKTSS